MIEKKRSTHWWYGMLFILSLIATIIAAITSIYVAIHQIDSNLLTTDHDLGQHEIRSIDGKYEAIRVGDKNNIHYQVMLVKTKSVILVTHAEYNTPNVVKAGSFSQDSKTFASAYHYGHSGGYTWIGVWNLETGKLILSKNCSGWISNINFIFSDRSNLLNKCE